MISGIKEFLVVITDNSKSWGFRTGLTISIIAAFIVSDYALKFTYNLHTTNKINQLDKIQTLKSNYINDKSKLNRIMRLEEDILNNEHYSELLTSFINNIKLKSPSINQPIDKLPEKIDKTAKPVRSIIWMIISSNTLLVIIFPILLFLPLYDKESRSGKGIVGWISTIFFIVFLITFVTWVSYQIPLILNRPVLNYIINFIIQSLFWFIIIITSVQINKKS